jgi:hypothetical protein
MAEIRVKSTGKVKLFESDNTSSVSIDAPSSLTADRTVTLPDADVTLAAGTMLATDGSGASLTALNATQITSGTIPDDARLPTVGVDKGGTNLTSYAAGDIVYASGTTAISKLTKPGTPAGEVLTFAACASAPSWATPFTGISWQAVQTSSPITGAAGKGYPINTTSGEITLNLPAGVVGDEIAFIDYAGTFDSNKLTITPDGSEKIKGVAGNFTAETERQAGTLVYVDSTQGWILSGAAPDPGLTPPLFVTATGGTITTCGDYKIHRFTGDGTFAVSCAGNAGGSNTVDYMVIAGGAGGSNSYGGGGGAGGYRESVPSPAAWTASPLADPGGALPVAATPYAVTVGGGGSGIAYPQTPPAASGSNSVWGSTTSAGGGGGGGGYPAGCGAAGGSGGGGNGGYSKSGGAGNTPPVSPPQGNPGGVYVPVAYAGGGGGGATCTPARCGSKDGGRGTSTEITGSSVPLAGGGGGGGGPQSGGLGRDGGGNGGHFPGYSPGGAGTVNTGGGAGGASEGPSAAGAGGSGVVVLRYKYQ